MRAVFVYGDDPKNDKGEWAGGVRVLELPLKEDDAMLRSLYANLMAEGDVVNIKI